MNHIKSVIILLFFSFCFTFSVNAQVVGGLAPSISISIYDKGEKAVGFGGDFILFDKDKKQIAGVTGSYNLTNVDEEEIFGTEINLNQHDITFGPAFKIEVKDNNTSFVGVHAGLSIFNLKASGDTERLAERPLIGVSLGVLSDKNFFWKIKTNYHLENDEIDDFFSLGFSMGIAFN